MVGYLTPSDVPDKVTCRALFVPDGEEYLAVVRGALQELTISSSWTKYGYVTPDEAASMFVDMFDRFCFAEGPCRMIGEIIAFAGQTSPKPSLWVPCDGRTLNIADYPDLWAVVGTAYGSGTGTFNVPDLRGRALSGAGQGEGLNPIVVGQEYGEQDHILSSQEMPEHSHTDTGHTHFTGNSLTSLAVMPGEGPVLVPNPIPASTANGYAALSSAGASQAHNTVGPRLGIMYLIVAKDG